MVPQEAEFFVKNQEDPEHRELRLLMVQYYLEVAQLVDIPQPGL